MPMVTAAGADGAAKARVVRDRRDRQRTRRIQPVSAVGTPALSVRSGGDGLLGPGPGGHGQREAGLARTVGAGSPLAPQLEEVLVEVDLDRVALGGHVALA